jgi:hypothetical protein
VDVLKGHDFSRAVSATKRTRALQLAEKLDFGLFCNKGTTLVGPQMPQNERGLYSLRKNSIQARFVTRERL